MQLAPHWALTMLRDRLLLASKGLTWPLSYLSLPGQHASEEPLKNGLTWVIELLELSWLASQTGATFQSQIARLGAMTPSCQRPPQPHFFP
eukprot:1150460-Pelagomonas_calceolata.AAC.2